MRNLEGPPCGLFLVVRRESWLALGAVKVLTAVKKTLGRSAFYAEAVSPMGVAVSEWVGKVRSAGAIKFENELVAKCFEVRREGGLKGSSVSCFRTVVWERGF